MTADFADVKCMIVNDKYKYSELTGKIIKCAMKVHCKLGAGFKEEIYQNAFAIELMDENLLFQREYEMNILYNDLIIGTRRSDFYVEGKIMVEIKAVSEVKDLFYQQIINYLEVCKVDIGLLVNFGNSSLEFKRFINEKNNIKISA